MCTVTCVLKKTLYTVKVCVVWDSLMVINCRHFITKMIMAKKKPLVDTMYKRGKN